MKKTVTVIVLVLGLGPLLRAQEPSGPVDCNVTRTELEVYRVSIKHILRDQEPAQFALTQEAIPQIPPRGLVAQDPNLWSAYASANHRKCRLGIGLHWSGAEFRLQRARFVKPESPAVPGLGPKRAWPSVSVSRVGFNPSADRAAVYCEFMRAPMTGRGDFLLLEKVDGTWRVFKSTPFCFF